MKRDLYRSFSFFSLFIFKVAKIITSIMTNKTKENGGMKMIKRLITEIMIRNTMKKIGHEVTMIMNF